MKLGLVSVTFRTLAAALPLLPCRAAFLRQGAPFRRPRDLEKVSCFVARPARRALCSAGICARQQYGTVHGRRRDAAGLGRQLRELLTYGFSGKWTKPNFGS